MLELAEYVRPSQLDESMSNKRLK